MANFLGKDQATYAKERDLFLRDLQHFHENRGTPFKRTPTLGGKEIDLYLLYTLVTSQGGWLRINSKNTWSEILPFFKLPTSCVNGSIAIKQIYLRYLDRWEKVHFLHEDADRASDDDEESRHKRWSARSLHSVPCSYNYGQHNITEANREHNHLSINLYKQSDYDRLSLSLISPLPNEQDFAINVCTLLSNDGKHTLKLEKHPRLINHLLAHAGVFSHSSMRQLFIHFYNVVRKKPIHNFWKDVLESQEFIDLTNETKFKSIDSDVPAKFEPLILGQEADPALLVLNTPGNVIEEPDNTDSLDCEIIEETCDNFKLKMNPEDSDLFCLKRSLGTQDYVGQRVLQIATILRNLSFIEENVAVLVKNTSFVRFLLLCSISRWNVLKNLGMDMLSNVASEFIVRDLHSDLLATKLLKIVTNGLKSDDRAACISALEVLNKLSQNEHNEEVMQKALEKHVYKNVCSFLTLHDVMLLIYTLECLYSLSSLGERSCNFIIINHGVIDTLVSLVTVEGKSYGPKACIGMKLVETLPSGSNQQSQVQNANQSQSTSQSQSGSPTTTTSTVTSSSGTLNAISPTVTAVTTATSTPVVSHSPTPKSAPSTPIRQVPIVPQRLMPINPVTPVTTASVTTSSVIQSTSSIMTPQQLIQQQHAHQQAIHENEQFALAWLRATYEPCISGKVDHQELYKHYLNCCSTIGRKGVISPLHFPRCVRSIFGGTVGPNPVKPNNSNDSQYYDGIKVRDKPLIINLPPVSPLPQPKIVTIPPPTTTKTQQVRRKSSVQPVLVPPQGHVNALTVVADNNATGGAAEPPSPASPILKAQLSAPPKQRDASPVSGKGDTKSQAMAHPHLSQALLGSTATTTSTSTSTVTGTTVSSVTKDNQGSTSASAGQTSNTSLIKSLLATKVNDCMSTVSMRTATDCQNVAQVAARQQRLLAQQGQTGSDNQSKMPAKEPLKTARLNGVRQLFTDTEIGDPSVSSTTQFTDLTKGKKEPPQPPPPPLAPLSNNVKGGKSQRIDNEDSDSIGNHSLASSSGIGTVGIGGVSSTEDGENSLTSFEGLLNGIPNVDNSLNEDSNSKDSVKIAASEITVNKPLRLADLLEKKFEKSPPLLNGVMGKELRLGDRAMDLVENHIEKALSRDNENIPDKCLKMELEIKEEPLHREIIGIKRSSSEEMMEIEAKRPLLSTNINGSSMVNSPAPDSSSSNGDDGPSTVSTAAAKLFADIAADILEDEDEEQLLQEAQSGHAAQLVADQQGQMQLQAQSPLQQIIVDNQQMLLAQQRQIIVSQAQLPTHNQMVFSTGGHLKTQSGQTVIVQNTAGQRPVMLAQPNTGQILLSQGLQGQMQIVASSQPGQYVLQASGASGQGAAYVVAQPQAAVVHGTQPQTVLLAQTPQQQGTGAKTIIILQQQPPPPTSGNATQHQKVVVTPQGQQVVVTQVPRPIVHTSSVSNNVSPVTKAIKSTPPSVSNSTTVSNTAQTQPPQSSPNINIVMTDKKEDIKKHKIARDLTTPYICEWGDCYYDKRFKSANEVYLHACAAHCPSGSEEITCQWDRCDNMKRKRFSLMTHLHDKHCNTEAMKQSLVKRKQAAHSNKPEVTTPAAPSPHPGYAPDAALHAIKRHALEFVNPKELQDDNEGPVTKSIRLTASLILRNLVIYSSHCKRYLKSYESHLANVALSNVESSRTIAQILFDMNDGSTHR